LIKAKGLLRTDFDKAAGLIANIPYYLVNPNSDLDTKKYRYVGSDAVYSETDILRHYVRMVDLDNGQSVVGKGKV
jgi:hypothetical protein